MKEPSDCQPLLPAPSVARPKMVLGPAKAVSNVIGITSVSVLPAADAELPAALTVHWELAIVPAPPTGNADDQPVPLSSANRSVFVTGSDATTQPRASLNLELMTA